MVEPMTWPDVDVIIGSKDGKTHLLRCLEFVYGQHYEGRIRTTVVDNNSSDASMFLVSSRYPQVQLIVNKEDLGLAAAYNQALARTSGKYVLFLSQDVEMAPNFVAEQVLQIEKSRGLSGLGARILLGREETGEELIDSIGIDLKGPIPILLCHALRMSEVDHDGREIFGPAAAAAFWARECLEKIAMNGMVFDEQLSYGHLDADLAWRARWFGCRSWYNPRAIAVHYRGILYAKDHKREREVAYMRIRGNQLLYRKNLLFDGWALYGGKVKNAVRKQALSFARKYGAFRGVDLWFSTKRVMKSMEEKAKKLENHVTVTPEPMFNEIFSGRLVPRR